MLSKTFITRVLNVLPELGRLCRPPEEALKFGLPSAQARIIEYLAMHKTATMSELAHKFGVSLPSITELVNKLVENGMVERTADVNDRRVMRIELTPSAKAICSKIMGAYKLKLDKTLGSLTTEEQETFITLLEKITKEKD